MCMCLSRGGVGGEGGEWMNKGLGWTLPILWEQGECWACVCVFLRGGVSGVGGDWTRVWRGGVVLCLCEVRVWILCIDDRSRYLCIMLGGYLRI